MFRQNNAILRSDYVLMTDFACWGVTILILIPCIINYVEINQINALNYILLYFSFTMASTCFGKTMPSSGSSYFKVMHLYNVTKIPENLKRQSCGNIREGNVDNVSPWAPRKHRIMEIQLHSFLTSAQNQRWSILQPGRFNFKDCNPGITD
jgi:hypothetical protein